jgi:hypothetical protein
MRLLMSHAAEGSLQAYLDGEIDSAAAAELSEHIAVCTACAHELNTLRRASDQARTAIGLLEAPAVPMMRAQSALAAARSRHTRRSALRLGSWSLAKAAMLLLVLAGASAAAIPDVRRAFESTLARVAELFGASRTVADADPVVAPLVPAPALEVRQAFVQPVAGRVRILLPQPSGQVEIVVRLIGGSRAEVETASGEQVRFVSSTGRLQIMGVDEGSVTIGIPRMLENASVEISGSTVVIKEGTELVRTGPGVAERGSELRFTAGS